MDEKIRHHRGGFEMKKLESIIKNIKIKTFKISKDIYRNVYLYIDNKYQSFKNKIRHGKF